MSSELVVGSGALVFILITVVYVLGKKAIEKHERRHRTPSDEERLAAMAADRKCSEFDLFRLAGRQWQITAARVDDDFRTYLTRGQMPHYVRDFIRKNKPRTDGPDRDITSPGGDLPPSWSA